MRKGSRTDKFPLGGVIAMVPFMLMASFSHLAAQGGLNIYGYFSVNYEDDGKEPDGNNSPGEFSFPHLNLMFQSQLSDHFRIYINLAGDGASTVAVRNYWGEYTVRDYLKFRAGKIYRPFDLFNERLDAVPTYLGIEPPELFDKDHLLVPRTGELMVHGNVPVGANVLKYSLMTGNKEVVDSGKPISWDLNLSIANKVTIGTSGYHSNEPGSAKDIGEGSPSGGVLPWMAKDKYTALGGYFEAKAKNITLQAGYWYADHSAFRDAQKVIMLDGATPLNAAQRKRFGLDKYAVSSNADDINLDGSYTISTYYVQFGYRIPSGTIPAISWDLIPYVFWDYYKNPETIAEKGYGGDYEAGLSDDGKFVKPTVWIAIKPL